MRISWKHRTVSDEFSNIILISYKTTDQCYEYEKLNVQMKAALSLRERGRETYREGERAFILSTSTALIRSLITRGNEMPGESRGRNGGGRTVEEEEEFRLQNDTVQK